MKAFYISFAALAITSWTVQAAVTGTATSTTNQGSTTTPPTTPTTPAPKTATTHATTTIHASTAKTTHVSTTTAKSSHVTNPMITIPARIIYKCFSTITKTYPKECPRASDPASYTKCCQTVIGLPSCCPGRTVNMCDRTTKWWFPQGYYCPQPGDQSYMTSCCGSQTSMSYGCCGTTGDLDALAGWAVAVIVIAVLLLVAGIALCVCCCCGAALGCTAIADCCGRRTTYQKF